MFTVIETDEFSEWLAGLKDGMTRIPLARRLDKARRGNLGDVEPVDEGVSEMREFFGPGWRMYFIEQDGAIIVMLGGGGKSTQQRDIERAKKMALELRNEQDQDPSI
ncbi:type II toxin-antitoxin system RelE/ParE family toxin [Variovorax sp. RHLX14]|uniref:type II toxin-antitoxin system RelE/ParE family toxin n=1 Tax=Variovorax sp. RHLX14 TaxID=1259731 RepID=UPI003F4840DF